MKISTMRSMDFWAGVPLCALASVIVRKDIKSISSIKNPKILIIHLSEMGAAVLAQPALTYLKERLPDAELFFLSFPITQALFKALHTAPDDHCLSIDTENLTSLASSSLKSISTLRSAGIDCVIDFEGYSRASAILSSLICPDGIRIGSHPYQLPHLYRGNTLTHKVLYTPHRHISHYYLTLINALWASPEDEPFPQILPSPHNPDLPIPYQFNYTPAQQDEEFVRQQLSARNIKDDAELIIINPNSSDMLPIRKWPLERYAQVAAYLCANNKNIEIIVTGTKSERKGAADLKEMLPGCRIHDFTGQTSLPQLLALYKHCRLLITNDSGPAHLAAITELPSVVLYGPETPKLFSPLGNTTKIIYKNLLCSPCVCPANGKDTLCRKGTCLKEINVQEVIQAAFEQLNK